MTAGRRVYVTEAETTKLIEASRPGEPGEGHGVPLAFGPGWVALVVTVDNYVELGWALDLLAEWRGIELPGQPVTTGTAGPT